MAKPTIELTTVDDPRWAAVAGRDGAADGTFVYGVTTTGVYCRPSCPSRRPHPRNVRFFANPAEAEGAGLRPCRRCDPAGPGLRARRRDLVARACITITEAPDAADLRTLAAESGLSPAHFHRIFKAETGITPKAYAVAHRAGRLRRALDDGLSVTDAVYAAGFGSNGPFYASSSERLGMTPTQFRDGAPDLDVRFAVGQCTLGAILVAISRRGVCAIEFGDDPEVLVRGLQDRFHASRMVGDDSDFENLVARVVALVEDPAGDHELPLDVRGTAFQERVWQVLRALPAGATVTYAEVAARIGAPRSTRAVAGACAANHLAVAIPCHRVVRTDGSPSGYRWGVERKTVLLEREGA